MAAPAAVGGNPGGPDAEANADIGVGAADGPPAAGGDNNNDDEPPDYDPEFSNGIYRNAPPVYGPETKKDADLRREAKSTKHLLRHKPFNKYCEHCCKCKMAAKRHFRGSFKRVLKRWGEIVTADHLVNNKKGKKHGVRGFKNAVNIKDLWSGLINCYPVKNKGHEEARKAFKMFCGGRKIQRIYSDNAGELKAAAEKLSVPHELSEPGVPVPNCLAERNN